MKSAKFLYKQAVFLPFQVEKEIFKHIFGIIIPRKN